MEDAEPVVKRRKLAHASQVLTRPFVSPFHRSVESEAKKQKPNLQVLEAASAADQVDLRELRTKDVPTSCQARDEDEPSIVSLSSGSSRDQGLAPEGKQALRKVGELSLAHQMRQLEVQIRAVRSDIDGLERATAILSSQGEDRLKRLTNKWRSAAQAAAEELFPIARERLLSMGGMSAWRESQQKQSRFSESEVQSISLHAEDRPHNERSRTGSIASQGSLQHGASEESLSTSCREATSDAEVQDADPADTFTMATMLQSLNIELDLIGYDVATEAWSEEVQG